ncbi:glycolipid transfer protein domain-containing protein 2 isoform X2 [Pelodiscus sinensis]|uniref:glycolipid transfer protein domain-containing protein 2 isoform X2 n=1 Tax=Pelodiscus sinensis TaxID=13735 RepID=UPI003F6C6DBA
MGPGAVGLRYVGMGPQRLLRILLPATAFLGLLFLSGLRLQLQLSACVQGGRPCGWFGDRRETASVGQGGKLPHLSWTSSSQLPLPRYKTPHLTPAPRCPGQDFQISRLLGAFRACVNQNGEILLQEYLAGWKELIKLIDALGSAFGLLARETQTKVMIMQGHCLGPHAPHYRTLQGMVAFELQHRLVGLQVLPPDQPHSGCRTLLRLHRALKWLQLFLDKLGHSRKGTDPSELCAEAYQVALARYHSWWVRQAAGLAFLALPSLPELLKLVCAQGEWEARAMLLTTASTLSRVYNLTQQVYASRGLLELP